MRLIVFDRPTGKRINFHPLALGRPIFELRCGMTSLIDQLIAKFAAKETACFVPPYLAEVYRAQSGRTVNDVQTLCGDDLLVIDARVKAADLKLSATGPSLAGCDAEGEVLYVRLAKNDLSKVKTGSLDAFLESAKSALPKAAEPIAVWNYAWDLVLANPAQITADFQDAGRSGIEGAVEEPRAIRGSLKDVYVAAGAKVHPFVVLDAERGPIYLDEGVEIHPYTRIEGPCYVGKKSILLGCKCREGNSIGPMCRVGGEVEQSILQGYSNKYHDGFLGHSYVGEWVNLGALTTNSDLKNDYSNVTVVLDGRRSVSTGSIKFGCLIGDHVKTSIGTLLPTGAYLGGMSMLVTDGKPLPKFFPGFSWFTAGKLSPDIDQQRLYEIAKSAMRRRGCEWTAAAEKMWDEIFSLTAGERQAALEYVKIRR
jgi:UDP-N-acetylglucosamine diphosphorylase / glucose-1-phosphate thymidylyltransferase / UDP-N-acetylgalactosamine diphosphorylase / glucosamine-1-phosphate N-acetyltransferase / galactosamine-1-phosphate N-acetyltransferase